MKKTALLILALGALAPLSALAKPYHYTPVSWIVETRNKLSEDDKYVTIIGHVTRRISDEEYWFTDGTGSIRLDSENFDLPIGKRIVIGGRIDQAYLGFGHIEVDVRKWHDAPRHPAAPKGTPPPASAMVPPPTPPPAPVKSPPPPAPAPAATTPPPPAPASTPAPSAPATTTKATPTSANGTPLAPPSEVSPH